MAAQPNFNRYTFDPVPANAAQIYQVLRGDFYVDVAGGVIQPVLNGRFRFAGGANTIHVSQISTLGEAPREAPAQVAGQVAGQDANVAFKLTTFIDHSGGAGGALQGALPADAVESPPNNTYPLPIYYRAAAPINVLTPIVVNLFNTYLLYDVLNYAINSLTLDQIELFVGANNLGGIGRDNGQMLRPPNQGQPNQILYNGTVKQINQGGGGQVNATNILRLHSLHPLILLFLLNNLTEIQGAQAAQAEAKIRAILNNMTPVQNDVLLRGYNMSPQLITQYLGWMTFVEQQRDPRTMANLTSRLLNALYQRVLVLDGQIAGHAAQLQAAQAQGQAGMVPQAQLLAAEQEIARLEAIIAVLRAEKGQLNDVIGQLKIKLADYKYLQDTIFGSLRSIYQGATSVKLANAKYTGTRQAILGILQQPVGNPALPAFVGGSKKRKMKGGENTNPSVNNIDHSIKSKVQEKITSLNGLQNVTNTNAIIGNTLKFVTNTIKPLTANQEKQRKLLIEILFKILYTKGIKAEDIEKYSSNKNNTQVQPVSAEAVSAEPVSIAPGNAAAMIQQNNLNTILKGLTNSINTIKNIATANKIPNLNTQIIKGLNNINKAKKTNGTEVNVARKIEYQHKLLNSATSKMVELYERLIKTNNINSKTKMKEFIQNYFTYIINKYTTEEHKIQATEYYLPKYIMITEKGPNEISFKAINKKVSTTLSEQEFTNIFSKELNKAVEAQKA